MTYVGYMAGIVVIFLCLLVPSLAILADHQQKMAKLLRGAAAPNEEIHALREDVRELKETVRQQAMSFSGSPLPLVENHVHERIGGSATD